jgi:secondary thiamine-phosphate synthase enzyme
MHTISIRTEKREQVLDITSKVQDYVTKNRFKSGIVLVYSPHTTAGVTVNENADPSVKRDLISHLRKLVPHDASFEHAEGNSDAHIKGSLLNFSQGFIVEDGRLQLGTWQGIFLAEMDGPRTREIWLKFVEC